MFDAQAAQNGGIVRRKAENVQRFGYYDALLTEVRARGWHMVECNGQIVVFCSPAPFHLRSA